MKKALSILPAVFFIVLLTTCASTKYEHKENCFQTPDQVKADWKKLNSYAFTFDFFIQEPRAICHVIRIDLNNPELLISPFPSIHSGPLYPSVKASKLAQNNDIVINTTPFAFTTKSISLKSPSGIVRTGQLEYSSPASKYCALAIYKIGTNYSAEIFQSQNDIPIQPANGAQIIAIQGGFWQILKNGRQIDFIDNQDSRTSCGLSKDASILYILIVEGEKKSVSKGLSYNQCATILSNLGAWNAMEFDGGSSTCLYLNGKNVLTYTKNPGLPAFLCFSSLK